MNFDLVANEWDTNGRIERAKIIADEILKNVDCVGLSTAMEFGCGTGLLTFNLCSLFKDVYLVDSSEGMIDVVKKKIDAFPASNLHPLCLDLTFNDLDVNVDFIYTSMAMHHVSDVKLILSKFNKLLTKDGFLCIVDLNKDDGSFHSHESGFHGHNGFSTDEFLQLVESANFKLLKHYTFYKGIKEKDNVPYSLFITIAQKI
ncbi:MAG: class I SAM-dependent methyltransferase [Clostridium sp.]